MSDDAKDPEGTDPGLSRRTFLLGAAGVTGVAVAAGAGAWPSVGEAAPGDRRFVTGYFALDLDGEACGIIQKFEGGDIEGVVVNDPPVGTFQKKHLSGTRIGDITVELGLTIARPVRDWIESSLQMNFQRKSGEIKVADFNRKVREIREFKDALLTEIGFPATDGSAKDAAFMNLKFSPWIVRNKKGDGEKVDNPVDMQQKQWHPSDFRFTIDGFEDACAKVSKVEGLTVKQSAVDPCPPNGDLASNGNLAQEPGKLEFPNLKITLSLEAAKPFYDWHEDFVINGNNKRDNQERGGTLEYLDARGKPLLTLTFQGLGIFKVSRAPSKNNEDKIASVTVEFYTENITAKFA